VTTHFVTGIFSHQSSKTPKKLKDRTVYDGACLQPTKLISSCKNFSKAAVHLGGIIFPLMAWHHRNHQESSVKRLSVSFAPNLLTGIDTLGYGRCRSKLDFEILSQALLELRPACSPGYFGPPKNRRCAACEISTGDLVQIGTRHSSQSKWLPNRYPSSSLSIL